MAVRPREPGVARRRTVTDLDETVLLVELAGLVASFDHWPTLREFADAGRTALYVQMQRTGGPERWAAEFGLPYTPETHHSEEQAVRAELTDFLSALDHWPAGEEFRAAGRQALYAKVLASGGPQRWRSEFGLAGAEEPTDDNADRPGRRHRRNPRRWTPELVRTELAVFLRDADHFPSEREFRQAGEYGLCRAVLQLGGADYWAAEFGLPRARARIREQAFKTAAAKAVAREARRDRHDRMIRELEEFCAGREFFPAYGDWKANGRTDLQTFVNANGGVQEWSRRLNLPLRPIQDRRPYGMDRALADGRAVIAQFGRIPNQKELQYAGYNKLWKFIRREFGGDRAAFATLCA